MTEDFKRLIDRLIRTYEPDEHLPSDAQSSELSDQLKNLAIRFEGLPVLRDWGGCFLLRPDLSIMAAAWDGSDFRLEEDPVFRNTVLLRASSEFEELRGLKPVREPDSPICPMCQGSGVVPRLPPELADSIVCYCGGLGWLPAGADLDAVSGTLGWEDQDHVGESRPAKGLQAAGDGEPTGSGEAPSKPLPDGIRRHK